MRRRLTLRCLLKRQVESIQNVLFVDDSRRVLDCGPSMPRLLAATMTSQATKTAMSRKSSDLKVHWTTSIPMLLSSMR